MSYPQYPNDPFGAQGGYAAGVPSLADQAADPATTPEQLRALLQQDPALAPIIAVNDNIDDPLREWLWEYGGDAVRQAMQNQYEQALAAQQGQSAVSVEQVAGYAQPAPVEPAPYVDQQYAYAQQQPEPAAPAVIDAVPGLVEAPVQPQNTGFINEAPVAQPQPEPVAAPVFERAPEPAAETSADVEDDDSEKTVLVRRNHRPTSTLVLETGDSVELTSDVVLLGRNPRGRLVGKAQVVRIPDAEKTISKTHAKLEWIDGGWFITDLESTNGVTTGPADAEVELTPNSPAPLEGPFALGLYRLQLTVQH
ncbi:FHA domain-containing protein [Pseudoclavibacter soli]|uniref:FHA domain-containing protein n=1 Tax=Pseudoclavibacter soli TaxID=452623 RepID=UPI00041EB391|nr:FHA domain-containing protein [Pseudoclavibacter soli]